MGISPRLSATAQRLTGSYAEVQARLIAELAGSLVTGHSDAFGSEANNLTLSRARAEQVRHALQQAGLESVQLTTQAQGEHQPIAYLRILRLKRVRAQLLFPATAELTVTEVATHWHFWHLGKFARDYAAMFGESPSHTLRRSLA